ncbi:MAG: PH domain-containing protein [Tunicatimonas sp.]
MTTHIPVVILLVNPALWAVGVVTLTFSVALFWVLYQNTFYQISYDGELRIKAPFFTQTINVSHIRCTRPHRSYRSYMYALSERKLIIYYGHGGRYVEISPKHRNDFIADLSTLNPSIEVKTEETYS